KVFKDREIRYRAVEAGKAVGGDVMTSEIDLRLPDELEFCINHKTGVIESNKPEIYMRSRGLTPEPNIRYFILHWNGREIPVRAHIWGRSLGKNDDGQWAGETYWTVLAIGRADHIPREPVLSYKFQSQQEYICAANLILRALKTYGGALN